MPRTISRAGWGPALAAVVLAHAAAVSAQSVTLGAGDEGIRVRVSRLSFIEGAVLDRLKDGRSVAVEFELLVLPSPSGAVVWQGRERFSLSFDIWEERFAVTRSGTPPRSITHLTARDAEAWCLDSLVIPRTALASLGPRAQFWLRLTYRVDQRAAPEPGGEERFTLRTLIDILARRDSGDPLSRTIEAGPFRVPG